MVDISWMQNLETTIWYFPNDYPSKDVIHDMSKYPGRFPPKIPNTLIKKYTKKGEFILDSFVGGGTTLIEACKLGRNSIGFDINHEAIKITKEKIAKTNCNTKITKAEIGDARNLVLKDNSIDLVITSPPYWNIIEYSNEEGCLGNSNNYANYLDGLEKSINEMYRVLKPQKYCCVVIGDSIDGWKFYPLGYQTQMIFEKAGFKLQRVIIHIQARTNSFLFGNQKVRKRVLEKGLFLLTHEYIIIGKKE